MLKDKSISKADRNNVLQTLRDVERGGMSRKAEELARKRVVGGADADSDMADPLKASRVRLWAKKRSKAKSSASGSSTRPAK